MLSTRDILATEVWISREAPELSSLFQNSKERTIIVASLALRRHVSFMEATEWLVLEQKIRKMRFGDFSLAG